MTNALNPMLTLRRLGSAFFALLLLAGVTRAQPPIAPGENLTLQTAIELTLRNHPSALAARSEVAAMNERIGEARSQLLPQVYGSAQYLGATDNPIGDTSYLNPGYIPRSPGTAHQRSADAAQTFVPENNYEAAIGVSQYLFDFGRTRGFIKQREYETAAAGAASKLTELDLIYEVTQRYFAFLAAHQKVKVYDKAVAQRGEEDLHAARVKASAGLVPQIDVSTADAELARAKVQLLDAQNLEQTSKAALDNAMGLGADATDYKLAGVLTYRALTGEIGTYYATALRLRPDLSEIEEQARAEGAKITQYRSDFLPTVHAVAGYNTLGTGTPVANNYDAGIVISWPIFNGFETEHQISEAKFHREALRHQIEALRQRIFLEVKSAFLNWQASLERIQRMELTVAASRSRLELATKRYDAGLGNIIELTDAERFYIEDDAAYIDALYGYAVTKAALDLASAQPTSDGYKP